MEENFIYDDLETQGDLGAIIEDLQTRNKQLQEHVVSLEEDIAKLCNKITEMKTVQDNLTRNMSELFNTAKNEVDRKDRRISELQTQLDDMIFKRTSQSHFGSKRKGGPSNLEEAIKRPRCETQEAAQSQSDSENSGKIDRDTKTDSDPREKVIQESRTEGLNSSDGCLKQDSEVRRKSHSRDNSYSRHQANFRNGRGGRIYNRGTTNDHRGMSRREGGPSNLEETIDRPRCETREASQSQSVSENLGKIDKNTKTSSDRSENVIHESKTEGLNSSDGCQKQNSELRKSRSRNNIYSSRQANSRNGRGGRIYNRGTTNDLQGMPRREGGPSNLEETIQRPRCETREASQSQSVSENLGKIDRNTKTSDDPRENLIHESKTEGLNSSDGFQKQDSELRKSHSRDNIYSSRQANFRNGRGGRIYNRGTTNDHRDMSRREGGPSNLEETIDRPRCETREASPSQSVSENLGKIDRNIKTSSDPRENVIHESKTEGLNSSDGCQKQDSELRKSHSRDNIYSSRQANFRNGRGGRIYNRGATNDHRDMSRREGGPSNLEETIDRPRCETREASQSQSVSENLGKIDRNTKTSGDPRENVIHESKTEGLNSSDGCQKQDSEVRRKSHSRDNSYSRHQANSRNGRDGRKDNRGTTNGHRDISRRDRYDDNHHRNRGRDGRGSGYSDNKRDHWESHKENRDSHREYRRNDRDVSVENRQRSSEYNSVAEQNLNDQIIDLT